MRQAKAAAGTTTDPWAHLPEWCASATAARIHRGQHDGTSRSSPAAASSPSVAPWTVMAVAMLPQQNHQPCTSQLDAIEFACTRPPLNMNSRSCHPDTDGQATRSKRAWLCMRGVHHANCTAMMTTRGKHSAAPVPLPLAPGRELRVCLCHDVLLAPSSIEMLLLEALTGQNSRAYDRIHAHSVCPPTVRFVPVRCLHVPPQMSSSV